ncbi:ABC transporter permease [Streptococcus sp. DD12]|uniref:ABC transporter permease n=1 Tax=Streptococcus sp. DD12 TaxID=1777880 RepID=UPI00079A2B38|nr:ABC transporter permease [Streptococcus sp. DD12]KXT75856.1 ABC transporter, permease protein EscB [Streptococcus sp. DD12]
MNALFTRRRLAFWQSSLRYLRFVFNDHFVLALLFLLGLVLYQYSQLLRHHPQNPLFLLGASFLWVVAFVWMGNIATYLEPADRHYLLVQEAAVLSHIRKAQLRSWVSGAFLLLLANAFAWPLWLAMGVKVWQLVVILLASFLGKWGALAWKSRHLYQKDRVLWDQAIAQEQKRQQGWLRFYALFTRVKGLSSSVKRRAFMDAFLRLLPLRASHLWDNLYARAFFRAQDYLGLTLRLSVLSFVGLVFLRQQAWVALGLCLLFNYLLYFQLLALANHYNYYPLAFLYPQPPAIKYRRLRGFLAKLMGIVACLQVFLALLLGLWVQAVVLVLGTGLMVTGYGYLRQKKWIDVDR